MNASGGVAVVEDRRYRDHRGAGGHPESAERLDAVAEAIAERADRLEPCAPRPAQTEEILRVHGREHLERVAEAARRAPAHLDADTYVCPESFEVALLAAGGAIDLTRRVVRGEARCGFAAVRPPGHHAESDRAMGFCLFNNAALAARAVQDEDGVERILLLDFDVHHGNGTQHIFEHDPTVLYFSTHQFPFYPGTGSIGEAGAGKGFGYTVNVPLPAGCGDAEYVGSLARILVPVASTFRPELILVSSGFDAHRDDPLGAMRVSGAGFRAMSDVVQALADQLCGGRSVFLLEGGYSPSGLREGTGAVLDALLDPQPAPPSETREGGWGPTLESVLERVRQVHGENFFGPGTG
jgi:acetoin utilization deacetylase AcuC-like enzyme